MIVRVRRALKRTVDAFVTVNLSGSHHESDDDFETVLFRTTITRTIITLQDRLSLPGSNPLLYHSFQFNIFSYKREFNLEVQKCKKSRKYPNFRHTL